MFPRSFGLQQPTREPAASFHVIEAAGLRWGVGLIALLSGLLLFTRLNYPLLEPDEARYAEIPLLMLRTGEFTVPKIHGKPYEHKPPLTYWLVAATYRVFGVSPATARLVPVFATWLCILCTCFWGCRHLGKQAGLGAGVVLTLMPCFLTMGRLLLLDSVFMLCVLAALYAGYHGLAQPRLKWSWWLLSALLAGLGVLAKGPAALVLTLPPLFCCRWLFPLASRPRLRHWLTWLGVALAVAAPWYILVGVREPEFLATLLWKHHVLRFAQPFEHREPWWFYGPVLLLELLPWTPLLIWGLYRVMRRGWPTWRALLPAQRVCLISAAWGLAFFSAAGCKLATYLMPILPLLALLLGPLPFQAWQALAAWAEKKEPGESVGVLRRTTSRWLKPSVLAGSGLGLAVLAAWLWVLLPGYARSASTGVPAARLVRQAEAEGVPVATYRHLWDSAAFLRHGHELQVFSIRQRDGLVEFLTQHERSLVLMRESTWENEGLPGELEGTIDVEKVIVSGKVAGVYVVCGTHRPG